MEAGRIADEARVARHVLFRNGIAVICEAGTSGRDAFSIYTDLSQGEQKMTTQSWEIARAI
jgi:hypothetical protein